LTRYDALDQEITDVGRWIVTAGNAISTFYDANRTIFIRDTVAYENSQLAAGRTSTGRAFVALIELLYWLAEEDAENRAPAHRYRLLRDKAAAIVLGLAKNHLGNLPDDPGRVRTSTVNGDNMFTDGHLLLSVSLLQRAASLTGVERFPLDDGGIARVQAAASNILADNLERMRRWEGGKIHEDDIIHDFVTLHAVRAADAAGAIWSAPPQWDEGLEIRIRNSVLVQLGRHSAKITSQFDPAELACSIALLHRFDAPDHRPLISRALKVIAGTQTSDGSWPTSRLISYGNKQLLFVASFEVALTLAELLISQIARGDSSNIKVLQKVLHRTFRLVANTFMDVTAGRPKQRFEGWSNDRVRASHRLESWATAVVLSFLCRYREALVRLRQEQILARYEVSEKPVDSFAWPDLAPILGITQQPDLERLYRLSDPTPDGKLGTALAEKYISPIAQSVVQRPINASLLLPGPPGTRKTSVVKLLAKSLGWPLLTLTPPDFLGSGGLEKLERTAANVFRDLMRLRRVVVLFDECEDFFRKREGAAAGIGGRTMGAFITAGMLPRLQRLRQRRWIIFVLATNAQLDELDPAAIRPGRFDFYQDMTNPKLLAQQRYIAIRIADVDAREAVKTALMRWSDQRTRDERGESLISFVVLDRLIERVGALGGRIDENALRHLIDELTQPGPPPLIG
jgi:hypothetical protein